MNALDWPNMKKEQRQKRHRELYKQAYPSSIKEKNYITLEDLDKLQGR